MKTELGSPEFWQRLSLEPSKLAAEVCLIDVADLDRTLQNHAALHAWISAAHEVARVEEERARWMVTRTRALAVLKAQTTPDASGKAKKTVEVIGAEADASLELDAANKTLLQAQEKRGALRAMAQALDDRRDMLIQISAKRRAESENYRR